MFQSIAKFVFHTLWGWKVEGRYPREIDKFVIMVMPHTSNWDFPVGIFLRWAIGIDGHFAIKDSMTKGFFGGLIKYWGGVGVDRSKHNNFVDAVVQKFKERDKFWLVIAPEGTRKKVDKLKSGFYYIALGAGVPIVKCKFDWGNKIVGFDEPFYPTGDKEQDFKELLKYFKGVEGYNKDQVYSIP